MDADLVLLCRMEVLAWTVGGSSGCHLLSLGVESRPAVLALLGAAALSPWELCSAVRNRGNSACGKHKVGRLWVEFS